MKAYAVGDRDHTMTVKTSLMRGAAFGMLVALGAGSAIPAQAAATKTASGHKASAHRRAAHAVKGAGAGGSAELRELRDEVHALQAQLNAQSATQAQTQAQVQQATASAQAAQAQIQTAQAQDADATAAILQSIPVQVASAIDAAKPPAKVAINDNNHFSLQSADGRYSVGLVGVLQFDAGGYLGFHPDSRVAGPQNLSTGVNSRRARFGASGVAGDFSYIFLYDAGNSQDTTQRGIEALQLTYNGIKGMAAEIGYSSTPFTLGQATSSNDILFLERSTPTNIAINFNAGDFRSNAGVRFFGDRYWVGAYVTGPSSSSDSHTQTGERLGAFQRAAFQVLKGPDYSLHLGVAYDELIRAPNSGDTTNSATSNGTPNVLSLSDQPELRIDPTTLVNSGTIGTAANPVTGGGVFDVESAATFRNFYYQGEYFHYSVDREHLSNATFDGGYAQVAWILTGENHKYVPTSASYTRIVPTHPLSIKNGGLGAFELAARVSYIDEIADYTPRLSLASQADAINGGRQAGYTLGLNWYPSTVLRFMLDYNHIDFDKSQTAAAAGAPLGTNIGAHFNAVSLRSQIVF